MAEVIRMPRLSDTMEEGVIVGWLKQVGDALEPGDILAEVETDKATMELENYHEGYLLYIGVKEGPVPVNGILAVIGDKDEDFKALLAEATAQDGGTAAQADAGTMATEPPTHQDLSEPAVPEVTSPSQDGKRVKASPLARKMADERGIDLQSLTGSGDHGRIVKKDVEDFAPPSQPAAKPAISNLQAQVDDQDIPLSQMRKVIAKRLSESKFGAPHFYVTTEIAMDEAMAARQTINAVAPVKISFNDLIVKASALALKQHPAINSSWLGDKIRINGGIHIGVAVAVAEGLLVPVIRHADQKSLSTINQEVKHLAELARSKKLQPEQMQGNSFTISNLGMFDVDEFTAIINPPDAAILAVGSIVQKPVVRNDQIVVGHTMKVTLSSDHRVIDGATAAQFLQTLSKLLSSPVNMLI